MKKIITLAAACTLGMSAMAQQSLWNNAPIVSPEINADKSVTFRIAAPAARSVQVTGDFLPTQKIKTQFGEVDGPGYANMVKGDNGVWEYTTQPLESELYSYTMVVDSLRINDPANVYTIRDIANVQNVFIVGGGVGDTYSVQNVPHGTVSRMWYDSPALGMKRRLTVYTPAGYESSGKKYPVFYLLHGAGGDEEAWIALGRTAQILDNLIAQGKAEPMIVVMTNGNGGEMAAPGESHEGLRVPTIMQRKMMEGSFETSFPDVVKFVDKTFRTRADKRHRAIAGLSMGGFHSLHISKQYPDMFDYVGLFSAAIIPGRDVKSPIYDDFEGKLATQFAKKPALYYIAIGNKDFLFQANNEYRALLDRKGYPYTYVETGEGHIWKNWRRYLIDFAPRLFKK